MLNRSPLLATLLLGDVAAQQRAAAELSTRRAWRHAVALAGAWRTIPPLRQRVGTLATALDDVTLHDLHGASVAAAAQSTIIAHRARVILQRFEAANVAALAFKGIGLIAGLYRTAGRRMVSDIDLIIAEADRDRACAALSDLGFAPLTQRLREYVEYLDRRPHEGTSSGNLSLVLTDGDGIEVDLHWRLGTTPPPAMAADAIIARGESVELYGIPIRVAAPVDAMALTVHHVLRDNFAPHSAVKDLCDLATWWQVQPQRWHVTEMITHAQGCGLTVPLLALWQILVSFDPSSTARTGVTALAAATSATGRRDANRLQRLFLRQLQGERLSEDLLRLLSPLVIARFVVRRLRDRGTARQLETEMALPQLSYCQRVARLLRHATHLNPATIREYTALLRAHRNSQAARPGGSS